MRICAECPYFIKNGPIWYDHFCSNPFVRRPPTTHPQTGEQCFQSSNDFGQIIYTEASHPYARDINPNGRCKALENGPLLTVIE